MAEFTAKFAKSGRERHTSGGAGHDRPEFAGEFSARHPGDAANAVVDAFSRGKGQTQKLEHGRKFARNAAHARHRLLFQHGLAHEDTRHRGQNGQRELPRIHLAAHSTDREAHEHASGTSREAPHDLLRAQLLNGEGKPGLANAKTQLLFTAENGCEESSSCMQERGNHRSDNGKRILQCSLVMEPCRSGHITHEGRDAVEEARATECRYRERERPEPESEREAEGKPPADL